MRVTDTGTVDYSQGRFFALGTCCAAGCYTRHRPYGLTYRGNDIAGSHSLHDTLFVAGRLLDDCGASAYLLVQPHRSGYPVDSLWEVLFGLFMRGVEFDRARMGLLGFSVGHMVKEGGWRYVLDW